MKRFAPLVTRIDDALPPALFRRLKRAVEALAEEGLRGTYQRTFWFPAGREAENVMEEAIAALVPRAPMRVAGWEWWLSRMRTSNVQVDFHRDCDERLARAGGPQRHPLRSSVLFLNRCRGGLLAVTRRAPNPRNPALAPDLIDFELVEPAPNRWVFFDGRLTHGVLDAENQLPGRRLPREPALRLSVPINWWAKRPTQVPELSRTRSYPALRMTKPLKFG